MKAKGNFRVSAHLCLGKTHPQQSLRHVLGLQLYP